MIYTPMTNKAMKYAYEKHHGQFDKNGIPYIFHPFHLAEQMDDEDSTIVSLLHDVVEDTDTSISEIEALGFNSNVINALKLLTHDKNIDYYDYIKKLSINDIATKVKIADLKHNSDLSRLSEINNSDIERIEKYKKSINYLINKNKIEK